MKFTKMQGAGNDYVYINCFDQRVSGRAQLARRVSSRNFGIGSDGLICVCPSCVADVRMEMYNADGSRAEMCGNGIRCVGKFAWDNGLAAGETVTVETDAGVKELRLNFENGRVSSVRVAVGTPSFKCGDIPVDFDGGDFIQRPVEISGRNWLVTALSVGNPHAVVFVDDVDGMELESLGPRFENHPLFPSRVNTEFVQIIDRETLKMRVWERGSGETLACGTGACAALAAAVVCERAEARARMLVRGGELFIEWEQDGNGLYLTGPAVTVFDGEYYL